MIRLTRLSGKQFIVNEELIKFLEATPDTVVTLQNDEKFMVKESVDEVVELTLRYRQASYHAMNDAEMARIILTGHVAPEAKGFRPTR